LDVEETFERLSPVDPVVGCRTKSRIPNQHEEILIDFESGTLRLGCDPDSDEIMFDWIGRAEMQRNSGAAVDALGCIVGLKPQMAWKLTNDAGFVDAFQIRFFGDERSSVVVQFEVAASTILISVLRRIPG
jgi:hypothetical protein